STSNASCGRPSWATGPRGRSRGATASASRGTCVGTRPSGGCAATPGSRRSCARTLVSPPRRGPGPTWSHPSRTTGEDRDVTHDDALDPTNPFAAPSTLPYGLPDHAAIRTEHYLPAIRAGLAEQLAEIEQIATANQDVTVENFLDAWERSGRLAHRA